MANTSIYRDIAARTGGDIYIGVVGPVRTGKSTFIKRFMDTLVLPNIDDVYKHDRALDELPQSSAGRTIMTTEPKFIPNEAVDITIENNAHMKVRMIDCVGYIVPSALGHIENDMPRMVHTPWFDDEVPFNTAAEIGTRKVINEHSTIGLVVTTDGTIGEIPRNDYEEAEERVITELKSIDKPFAVLVNSAAPEGEEAIAVKKRIEAKYSVPVIVLNCMEIGESEIKEILKTILFEFPISEIGVDMPRWITNLSAEHWLRTSIIEGLMNGAADVRKIRQIKDIASTMAENENIDEAFVSHIDLSVGTATVKLTVSQNLFFRILSEETGMEISGEEDLVSLIVSLNETKRSFEKFETALRDVETKGYGIVMPSIDELTLEEPEIVTQGGKYGVKLRASAPSIHMLRANIETEVSPIVGSEKQSQDLILYLLKEFEESPQMIWQSDIFGKSLHELVNEGLHSKLHHMPDEARLKLQETLERIINEGCSGLLCVIL